MKKSLLVGFVVSILVVGAILFLSHKASDVPRVQLPQEDTQKIINDHTRLYASNENLTDMLIRLDIFFKNQGLNSDTNSPDFKPPTGADGLETISTCVAFKYFSQNDSKLAARFTLIPTIPECFSNDPLVTNEIKQLYTKYHYVYGVQTF